MSINTEQVYIDGKYHAVPPEVADEIASLRSRLERSKDKESRLYKLVEKLELQSKRHFTMDDYADGVPDGYGDAAVWLLRELESEGGGE